MLQAPSLYSKLWVPPRFPSRMTTGPVPQPLTGVLGVIGASQDPFLNPFDSEFHTAGKTSKGYSTGKLRESNRKQQKAKGQSPFLCFPFFSLFLLANSALPSEITDCVHFCSGFVLSAPPPLCCRATCRCVPPRCVRQPPLHPASLYL